MESATSLSNNERPNSAGGSHGPVGSDPITNHLAGMSKRQLYDIVCQMKDLIQQNQQQARQILIANPQLTKTLFQAQVMLGMVQPPQVLPNIPQTPLHSGPTQSHAQPEVSKQQAQPMEITSTEAPLPRTLPVEAHPREHEKMQVTQNQQLHVQGTMNLQPQNVQLQPEIPRSQALVVTSQSSQSFLPQHPVQSNQHPPASTTSLQPLVQIPPANNIPVQIPLSMQHTQSQTPPLQHIPPAGLLHQNMQPPLPQHSRIFTPAQVAQAAQSVNFQFPSNSQHPPLTQPSFQYPQQAPLPLPNQLPPQQPFQVGRSSVDMAGTGGMPSVSIGLPGHQVGRGPGTTWSQPPAGGTGGFMGYSHGNVPSGTAGYIGPVSTVAGGIPPTAPPLGHVSHFSQQDPKGYGVPRGTQGSGMVGSSEGIGMPGAMSGQGYGQAMLQQQPPLLHQAFDLDQQKGLLQQIMNLTPEQLNSLPPEQRQQIIQLQQAFQG